LLIFVRYILGEANERGRGGKDSQGFEERNDEIEEGSRNEPEPLLSYLSLCFLHGVSLGVVVSPDLLIDGRRSAFVSFV